jgi:hypothetical protein
VKHSFAFFKYFRHINRLFAGQGTLQTAAYEQEILCPEERAIYQPAIYLDGQLERVTSSPSESTKEMEIETATKLTGRHASTIAYHLKDVALIDGSIYGRTLRFFIMHSNRSNSAEPQDFERAALVSTFYGSKYFGHWLKEDCTLHILANELGIPTLCLPTLSGPHIGHYKSLLQQDWAPIARARIKHLTIFGDYHENSLRLRRYEVLRRLVAAKFPRKDQRSFVYLKRGKLGVPRKIQNENEILDALARSGFVIIDVERTPVEEILEILVNAKLVVSIEGSQVSHCVYAVPIDCALLILQPPDRFAANHRLWSNCLGVSFGFVVGTTGATGYLFNTTEIFRTIDLLLAQSECG